MSIKAVQIIDLSQSMNTPGYEKLARALIAAYDQAAAGKGKERHANNQPFEDQPMSTINRALGSIDGFLYQAHKKSLESKRLPLPRAQAELLGAINYLAGAYIELQRQIDTTEPTL
jgi:hypothetical protein